MGVQVPANPLVRRTVVKKRTKKFRKAQFDVRPSVPESWRKPRGIDGVVRRRFRGKTLLPNIGYGSNKRTRHLLPCGLLNAVVRNVADLEPLHMQNRKYAATVASNVGRRNRAAIVERARVLGIHVTNAAAGLRTEETAGAGAGEDVE